MNLNNEHQVCKKKIIWIVFMIPALLSCGHRNEPKTGETITKNNISTTFSTDTAKLSRLIDIKDYKPVNVKFKYTFIDNSGKNERLTVPGPSDSYLQAVLYFDTKTFQKLRAQYFTIDYPSPNYNRQEFSFDWLDTKVKEELKRSDASYHGHTDYFFGSGQSGKLWFLDNKLLLIKNSN